MSANHKPATPLPWQHDDIAHARQSYEHDPKSIRCEMATLHGPGGDEIARFVHDPDDGLELDERCATDAAYLTHAANAYPKLVAALRDVQGCNELVDAREICTELLRELGEDA